MRLRQPELRRARIEIIPMIDTIFFLLVFFMITWMTIVKTSGLELTQVAAGQEARKARSTIEISVSRAGAYFVDGKPSTAASWQSQIRGWLDARWDGGGVIVVSVAPSQKTRTLLSVLEGVNRAMAETHRRAQVVVGPNSQGVALGSK
jgi:biopolymer transport protein ExbD